MSVKVKVSSPFISLAMLEPTYVEGFHNKNEVVKMEYRPLGNTGLRVSHMSLGGAPIGGIYETLEEEEAITMIQEAIKNGVNYIDTAPWYGQGRSEEILGKALASVPREAYYIATKVGRYEKKIESMFDFSAERAQRSIEKSLKLLGLPYVDIIQIHDFQYAENLDQIIYETLPAIQKFKDQGLARFIGITGYPLQLLEEVMVKSPVKIDTILTHSRNTLIDHELENFIPAFREKGVGIINGGVFALGLLTSTGPQPWHPAQEEMKKQCLEAALFCKEHNVDIAQLAIQHSKAMDGVVTHVLGSGSLEVFRKNWKYWTTETTSEQQKLGKTVRERFFLPLTLRNWEVASKKWFQELRRKT